MRLWKQKEILQKNSQESLPADLLICLPLLTSISLCRIFVAAKIKEI